MNWNDLPTFLAIAEHGSLAGAARALGVNHSTVFRRLNALEADLEARLFDRFPEGYLLTPSGERLRELASAADAAVQQIEREIVGRDLEPCGTVRVTAVPNIARTLVAETVATLRETHPGLLIEVLSGDTDYDLNRREADIAVRATLAPPPHLVGRKVQALDWWLCRAADSPDPVPDSMDALEGLPLIGADAGMLRLKAFQWLERRYGDQIVARANELSTMAAMARAGVGYAVLPTDQPERGLRRLLTVPGIRGELWLLTHPDLRNITRNRVVWDALVQRAGLVSLSEPGPGGG